LKEIKTKDLATLRAEEEAEEQRIQDLELALADQTALNADLLARQQDTELFIADLVAAQGGV